MKWGLGIFICTLEAFAGCNNNATENRNQDSTVQSSLPAETNYVMENNINEPIKNSKTNTPGSSDTTQLTTNAVDSIVPYLVDTVSMQK